jgi:hypothetical protein
MDPVTLSNVVSTLNNPVALLALAVAIVMCFRQLAESITRIGPANPSNATMLRGFLLLVCTALALGVGTAAHTLAWGDPSSVMQHVLYAIALAIGGHLTYDQSSGAFEKLQLRKALAEDATNGPTNAYLAAARPPAPGMTANGLPTPPAP